MNDLPRIARFEKVSFDEYAASRKGIDRDIAFQEWKDIRLPERATSGSAGYDFFIPMKQFFRPETNTFFPTGIRCLMNPGLVLILCPKSGLGNKYGMRLTNTIGVVDSDYAFSDNEGHIMVGISTSRQFDLDPGSKFLQGILIPYSVCDGDTTAAVRNGGFGSTGG